MQVSQVRAISKAAPQRGSKQSAQGSALGTYAPNKRALKGQKHYNRGAFALTGRGYLGTPIPRAMPWAMSSLALQAVHCHLRNLN